MHKMKTTSVFLFSEDTKERQQPY